MIGRTTLWEQLNFYPPDDTRIIVKSSPSFKISSIGIGDLSLITINVSGFIFNFSSKLFTVDPVFRINSFDLFERGILAFTFT